MRKPLSKTNEFWLSLLVWMLLYPCQLAYTQVATPASYWYGCINSLYSFRIEVEASEGKFFYGTIYHDQLNKSYEVSGQIEGEYMIIHELDDHMNIVGRFEFSVNGHEAKGEWIDPSAKFSLIASLSKDKTLICGDLTLSKYKISSYTRGQGVLWLADMADQTRIGRFWNEESNTFHRLISFNSGSELLTYCDSTQWPDYIPEEDPLALEVEYFQSENYSLANEDVLIDCPVFLVDELFADSLKKMIDRHAEKLLNQPVLPDENASGRWQSRYYLNTDIDHWNTDYLCGSVELVGPAGVIDGYCFIYDRTSSAFADISHFLKSKYSKDPLMDGTGFEPLGISFDRQGIIIKGYFDPIQERHLVHIDWRDIKKQFKGRMLDKLLEL